MWKSYIKTDLVIGIQFRTNQSESYFRGKEGNIPATSKDNTYINRSELKSKLDNFQIFVYFLPSILQCLKYLPLNYK